VTQYPEPMTGPPGKLVRTARVAFGVLSAAGLVAACSQSPRTDATSSSRPPPYRVLVDAGLHLYRDHNLNAAEQLFYQAIRRDRHLPQAYFDLGVLYQSEGLQRAALANFMHAASVAPGYYPALYNEAVLESRFNAPYAMSIYRHVIAIHPDSPTAYLNLGLLELAAHERPQAIHDLRQAVRFDPSLQGRVPPALRAAMR
jgi:tetratricopeptide (TPR) repeat protein